MAKTKPDIFIEEFPFKPKNILSSIDVIGMTPIEFGVYCKLLFVSWIQQPEQCFLRLEEDNICKLCNLTSEQWREAQTKVLKKFKVTQMHGAPHIHNEVLLGIYKRERASIEGGAKTKEQLSFAAQLTNYPFEDFWKDYDKKVGDKNRLYKKWLKLSDAERETIKKDIPKRKDLQPNKQLRPNAETYLNGRRWEDEYIDWSKIINKGTKPGSTGANADYNAQRSNPV